MYLLLYFVVCQAMGDYASEDLVCVVDIGVAVGAGSGEFADVSLTAKSCHEVMDRLIVVLCHIMELEHDVLSTYS